MYFNYQYWRRQNKISILLYIFCIQFNSTKAYSTTCITYFTTCKNSRGLRAARQGNFQNFCKCVIKMHSSIFNCVTLFSTCKKSTRTLWRKNKTTFGKISAHVITIAPGLGSILSAHNPFLHLIKWHSSIFHNRCNLIFYVQKKYYKIVKC
jgi:hypothetical protein